MKISPEFLKSIGVKPSHFKDFEHTDLAALVPFKAKVHFFDSRSVLARATMENYVKYVVSSIERGEQLSPDQCRRLAERAFDSAEAAKNKTKPVKAEPAEKSEPEVAATKPRRPGKLDPNLLGRFE